MFDDRPWFDTLWRGLALLLLLSASVIIALTAVIALDQLGWIPPLRPEFIGSFSFDAQSSFAAVHQWEARWVMGTLLTLTGLIIWLVRLPLQRWLFGVSARREASPA